MRGLLIVILLAAFSADCVAQSAGSRRSKGERLKDIETTGAIAADTLTTGTSETSASQRASLINTQDERVALRAAITTYTVSSDSEIAAGYRLDPASSWYDFDGTTLSWRDPVAGESHYLMVSVQDNSTSTIIPGCKVVASITDGSGKDVFTSQTLYETWDPDFRHYGNNVNIPTAVGSGTLTLKIDPPIQRRRNKVLGAFFHQDVKLTFTGVATTTPSLEQKTAAPSGHPEKAFLGEGRRPYVEPTPYPGS